MTRRKSKNDRIVECINGETFLQVPHLSAYFRYRKWLIQINPKYLFPGQRKEHRKIIYVHGKKYGYAEYRGGCIPLQQFNARAYGVKALFLNLIRRRLGVACSELDKGYYYIALKTKRYIVTRSVMKDGGIFCRVFFYPEGEAVGSFIIDKDFSKAYPTLGAYNIINTMYVIIAYVVDSLVYSRFAAALNHTVEII